MRARLVPALLCAASLGAGEAPALLRMEAGDLAATRARYEKSVYAKIWNLPSLAPLRAKATESMKQEGGIDAALWFASVSKASYVVEGMRPSKSPNSRPLITGLCTIVAPGKALELAAALAKFDQMTSAGSPNTWNLADNQAVMSADADTVLVKGGQPTAKAFSLSSKADGIMTWDGGALAKSFAAIAKSSPEVSPDELAQITRLLADLPSGKMEASLTSVGTRIEGEIAGASKGLIAIDPVLLGALPANTLSVWALGLDMGPLWERYGKEIIEAKARNDGRSVAEVAQELDQTLSGMGVAGGAAAAAKATKGSLAFAILPGAPFPTVSLIVPRGPLTDALMSMAAAQWGVQLPANGAVVQKPAQSGGGMQIPAFIGTTATYSILSTDPVFSGAFAKGSSSGFSTGTAGKTLQAKQPGGACFVSASDTPALIMSLQAPLGMAMMAAPAEAQEALGSALQALPEIAAALKPGYSIARVSGATTKIESEGAISILGLPVMAGMLLPAIGQVRMNAQRAKARQQQAQQQQGQQQPAPKKPAGGAAPKKPGNNQSNL